MQKNTISMFTSAVTRLFRRRFIIVRTFGIHLTEQATITTDFSMPIRTVSALFTATRLARTTGFARSNLFTTTRVARVMETAAKQAVRCHHNNRDQFDEQGTNHNSFSISTVLSTFEIWSRLNQVPQQDSTNNSPDSQTNA